MAGQSKKSQGIHGSTRTHLTEIQKVLLGKGLVHPTKK